jgi:two-component system, chemotaxis family, protein-glutamate methylesterase/glutaminase
MSARRAGEKIRVLVVEDSLVVRELLVHMLSSDPEIAVIATASNGVEAIAAVQRDHPDVITMDVNMPKLNGLDATRRIMELCPTPIVIVSGSMMQDEVAATFRALEAGALAFVEKPNGVGHCNHGEEARQLVETVKLMSEVKVVRRWPKREAKETAGPHELPATAPRAQPELIAIGASTGGPIVLKSILSGLRKEIPVPILMVQHIAPGFTAGFAEWLAHASGFVVQVPAHDQSLLPGHAYLAPDGLHMQLGHAGKVVLSSADPEHGHRPSISRLFRSVAQVAGASAIGVLLTGMGRDGAEELKLMRDQGAITIAQDQDSSVVHGMPGEAIRLNAATHVLSPGQIVAALERLIK